MSSLCSLALCENNGAAMSTDDAIKTASSGIALVKDILTAAGENKNVKDAGENLGQAALTIAKAINNTLLPIAAVNFAFDKAKTYFKEKFEQDISAKTSKIPPEKIIEPKASIAGPALQGLAFTHEEPNLKEMYLCLLATAMDGRVTDKAHPAFVEVIRQLSSQEANIIKTVLQSPGSLPIVEVRLRNADRRDFTVLMRNAMDLLDLSTNAPIESPELPAMIDNWVRLGLVSVNYLKELSNASSYSWVDRRPEIIRLRQSHESEKSKVEIQHGVLDRTDFGIQFARAVSIV